MICKIFLNLMGVKLIGQCHGGRGFLICVRKCLFSSSHRGRCVEDFFLIITGLLCHVLLNKMLTFCSLDQEEIFLSL